MARLNSPNPSPPPQNNPITQGILYILGVLISIGDIIRWILRAIISFPKKTYNRFQTLRAGFVGKRKRGRPRKSAVPPMASVWKPMAVQIRSAYQRAMKRFDTFGSLSSYAKREWEKRHLKQSTIQYKRPSQPYRFRFPRIQIPSIRLPRLHMLTSRALPPPPQQQSRSVILDRFKYFTAGICVTVIFFFAPYMTFLWLRELPNPELLSRRDLQVTTKIFDRNGTLLYEIYADQNRTPLELSEIPQYMKEATIAIEDRDFYKHNGISWRGIARAAREIFFNNRFQGGSTITQQLIKSALLSPERTLIRKVKEVILAFSAERLYSKNQILEMYLNQVPYGGTAWGIEAASLTYFGKSVRDLNLAEAALLAGLPAAPTEYSPFGSHPEKAYDRQREVLRRMAEDRYITKEEEQAALATRITFTQPRTALHAPHFVMYVKNLLEKKYGARLVEQGGLRITTSLDLSIQERAEEIVYTHINSLANLRVGNGAALVTDPNTGEILAMVGSKNYFDVPAEGNVNVTTSLRQPGSSIKVVNYAAALENGFTAASIIEDSPIIYRIPGSPPYAPVNYDGRFHGMVPLRYALANSYNIPAVKILEKIGVSTMIEKGRLMGITTWNQEGRYGLSLTLGGGDVTMLDMAKVFGTLANEGRRVDLVPVLEVTDYTGDVLERNKPSEGIEAVKPETAWIMSNILSDNTARIAAFGPNSSLVIPDKTVSVKTGTSNDKRDNWTIGYTPSYVVTVWVGNNDNSPMHPLLTSGVTGAAPIWHDVMVDILKNKPNEVIPKPDTIITIPCYLGRPEYFIAGTEPKNGRCGTLPTGTPSISPPPRR